MKVPFNDLSRIHNPIKNNVLSKFSKVIDKNDFILNNDVNTFEKNFSKYTNQKYSISCANGTDAIELILRGLGIGKNDEVIVPVNTYIATSFAVDNVGAKPVFVDNDQYYLINIEKIKEKINKNTKAIIGVNLYGQMCNVKELKKLCKDYNLYFIEDAAQAHGATQSSLNIGDNSIAASYSFYPGKNLGAWGDGGIVTTNSYSLYKKLFKIRNFGSEIKYYHEMKGVNTKLQPIQAILLNEKLKYIDQWNNERRGIAETYLDAFDGIKKLKLPKKYFSNTHVWHLFVIEVANRNKFIAHCKDNNIETGIHYPYPIIKQKAYKDHFQNKEVFEESFSQYYKLVTLPVFPKMQKKEVTHVIKTVKNYFK